MAVVEKLWEMFGSNDKPEPKRVKATVLSRDENGIVWVHIEGGTAETPVYSTTADVKQGDTVLIRIEGGKAYIDGSTSEPSIGNGRLMQVAEPIAREAQEASELARETGERVEETVRAVEEAAEIATAVGQHFWSRDEDAHSDGAGTGAFVTDETRDEFLSAAEDGFPDLSDEHPHHNLLMNSLGMLIRTALKNLTSITRSAITFFDGTGNEAANVTAMFGKDGAQVGSSTSVHSNMSAEGFSISDGEGVKSFDVSGVSQREIVNWSSIGTASTSGQQQGQTAGMIISRVIMQPTGMSDEIWNQYLDSIERDVTRVKYACFSYSGTMLPDSLYLYGAGVRRQSQSATISYYIRWTIGENGVEADKTYTVMAGDVTTEWTSTPVVTIGNEEKSHAVVDFNSIQMVDKNGVTYFDVEDMRDEEGVATLRQTFVSDGSRTSYALSHTATDTDYTVTVSDQSGGSVTKSTTSFYFQTAPTAGSTVTVDYESSDGNLHSYTLGIRHPNAAIGASSVAEGHYVTASGEASHAEGVGTTASAKASHAQNDGTVASSDSQTAMGRWNEEDPNDVYALIVGNGSSASNRSNAFTVDWNGNLECAGNVEANGEQLATQAEAVKSITRNGDTFTATMADGSTFTFTQRDLITGVKGNAESSYRTGNVNITPQNIGAATTAVATESANGLMPSAGMVKINKMSFSSNVMDINLSDTLSIRIGAASNRLYVQLKQNGTWTGQKNIATW